VLFSTVLSDCTSNNSKLATFDHITGKQLWLFSWCISKMYKLYAMSQKHGTKFLSIFLHRHWQQKNFANQSDSWPWQTICNKTALKFPSCLK